jgi:hypothetical protein
VPAGGCGCAGCGSEDLVRALTIGERSPAGDKPPPYGTEVSPPFAELALGECEERQKASCSRWGVWGERRSLPSLEGAARKSLGLASEALGECEERQKASPSVL